MNGKSVREQVLATALSMNSLGLNQGSSGNVSARDGRGFWITPTALPYDRCTPDDLVWLDWSGQGRGRRKPSSEWRMHADIYRTYPEAGGILHAHSLYCTTLACLERPITAFHYMVALAGGDSIRCAPYAAFGSQALSDAAVAALRDRSAALLAHHGMICHAADLDRALALAVEVETLARMYLQALAVTEPPVLSAAAMAEALSRFSDYRP
ncbi:MAG: class II aldolase/adducin family protein [Proteobacteria bacterium]|nr:class II aldolase/adducin family protein [Pseudomonadota bacterium]